MLDVYDFDGQTVAYERAGFGAPLVLLHNGGASHAIWRHTTSALSEQFETFAPDLLGYGASDQPGSGYTLDNYVDMLGELIEAHHLEPVSLVGNCMGSAIALRFAMRRPEAVRALVLVNPLTRATFAAGGFGTLLRLQDSTPRLARVATSLVRRIRVPRWAASQVIRFQLGQLGDGIASEDNDELCACYANDGQMTSLLAVVDDMDSYAALDELEPESDFPPICTIWGLDNRVLSAEAGRELNRQLRPAREVWLEACGHLPMLERPRQVSAAIASFLAEVL